jgi:hypothetical protein
MDLVNGCILHTVAENGAHENHFPSTFAHVTKLIEQIHYKSGQDTLTDSLEFNPRQFDNYCNLYLEMTDIDLNMIQDIEFIYHTNTVIRLTGRYLHINQLMRRLDMTYIEIPNIEILTATEPEWVIKVNFKKPQDYHIQTVIESMVNCFDGLFLPSMIPEIRQFLNPNVNGNLSVYAKCKLFKNKDLLIRRKEIRRKEILSKNIEQYSYESCVIASNCDFISHKIINRCQLMQMIITLSKHSDNPRNDEYLPILEEVEFLIQGIPRARLTGRESHILDKLTNDIQVPKEPIYTITLDARKDVSNPKRTNTSLSLHRCTNSVLNIRIKPQPIDILVQICYVKLNTLETSFNYIHQVYL